MKVKKKRIIHENDKIIIHENKEKEEDTNYKEFYSENNEFRNILNNLAKIDFEAIAIEQGLDRCNESTARVIAIRYICKVASDINSDLCVYQGNCYIFTGCYWKKTSEDIFTNFLQLAIIKLGYNVILSDKFEFKEKLFKQFESSCKRENFGNESEDVSINLKNGTFKFDGTNYKLEEFNKNDMHTYQLAFVYNPEAEGPKFEKFLNEVLPDKHVQNLLAEFLGYVFISPKKLKLEKLMVLLGTGANGKSVLYEILVALFGKENVTSYSLEQLTKNQVYIPLIAGILLNYAPEMTSKVDSTTLKMLATGEPIQGRELYKNPVMIYKYSKLMFNANKLPEVNDDSEGFWRRFLIIKFDVTILEKNQDKELSKKIIESELPFVLNWVLEGLKRLLINKNFTIPESVKNATDEYKSDYDIVKQFLDDCNFKASDKVTCLLSYLYSEFRTYCHSSGINPMNLREFSAKLKSKNFISKRNNKGTCFYIEKF